MHNDLTTFLQTQTDIRLAIVFGSAAAQRLRPESDIDLAVQCDAPLSPARKSELIASIALIGGRPVDLVDLRTAGQPLLGQILQGHRIKGSAEQIVPLALRNVLERADFFPLIERTLTERRRAWMQA
jgi:predicted nucleotidyltransferase